MDGKEQLFNLVTVDCFISAYKACKKYSDTPKGAVSETEMWILLCGIGESNFLNHSHGWPPDFRTWVNLHKEDSILDYKTNQIPGAENVWKELCSTEEKH